MKLTHAQSRELKRLHNDSKCYVGSCVNPTMKVLQKNGLVVLEWFDSPTGYYGRDSRWVITDEGKKIAETK